MQTCRKLRVGLESFRIAQIGAPNHSFIHKSILQVIEKKATKTSNNTRKM